MSAIHVLLRDSIDYAGLFPPAGLDMSTASSNYAAYRAGEWAWALGRFIVPASRLSELQAQGAGPWLIAALIGPDLAADLEQIAAFNRGHVQAGAAAARVDTVELKASSVGTIEDSMRRIPSDLQGYVEIPIDQDPSPLVSAIARLGVRAKVRTGGVTRDAFPPTPHLVRFLRACIGSRVPFKATAGLHHPLRAEYRLTYELDSASGTMFGFLNLFLATAFLRSGAGEDVAAQILEEGSPEAFGFADNGVSWRDRRLDLDALRQGRQALVSFGSCSFTEPIEELQALQLLPARVRQA
jgi:hypothetical protein